MTAVLDASALLAYLQDEPGADQVGEALDGALVCAVNWTEVVQKSLQRGIDVSGMRQELSSIGVSVESFTPEQADIAARLWVTVGPHGLSLANRACLALAIDRRAPVLTADRAWASLALDVEVRLLR